MSDFGPRICDFCKAKDKATPITLCRIKGTAQTKSGSMSGCPLLRNVITVDNDCSEEVVKRIQLVHEALLSRNE